MGHRMDVLYEKFRETTWFDVTIMVLKHIWNPSVLMMPNLFRNGGYILSGILYPLIGSFMIICTIYLSEAKAIVGFDKRRFTEDMLCPELSCYVFKGSIWGRGYEALTKISDFLVHFGKSALYILIVAKIVTNIYSELSFQLDDENGVLLMIGPFFIVLSLLTLFRSWFRLLYTVGAILLLIVTCKITELVAVDLKLDHDQLDKIGEWDYIPTTIALSFFSHSYLSPICNNDLKLKNRNQYFTLTIGWIIYGLISMTFGGLCYLGLNETTETLVIFNFFNTRTSLVLKIITLLACTFMYGNEFNNTILSFQLDFENWSKMMYFPGFNMYMAKSVLNLILSVLIWMLAVSMHSMEMLASLIGATGVIFLNGCIPLFIYIVVIKRFQTPFRKVLILVNVLLLLFGVALSIYMCQNLLMQTYHGYVYFKFT